MSGVASDEILPLVRRWAIDWLCSHDASACDDLMSPEYSLRIGGMEFAGRDSYRTATAQLFTLFPGVMLTVHEVLTNGVQAAVRFTEHGASVKHNGRTAAWAGVALLEGDGRQLTRGWADEDYHARRRQLATGISDGIAGPAVAPWDTPAEMVNLETEAVVRSWILKGLPAIDGVVRDDADSVSYEPVMIPDHAEAEVLISAGQRAAFHGSIHGVALGGHRKEVSMSVSGLVAVANGVVSSGIVVSDRLGALSTIRGGAR